MIRKFRHIAAASLALFLFAVTASASEWTFENVERVVAISDIHGAYGAMVRTLEQAEVIDASEAWSGGTTHLVIVGDLLDRGPKSRQAMDLLMRLEDEAAAAGGRVHVLIGNHEAMNLIGDLRYVAKEEYAAFSAEETPAQRERWFEAYIAKQGAPDAVGEDQRRDFDERFPPGFFAHRDAFASDGKYGSWLLTKPIIIVINGTAYVHGGVSPMIAEIGLAGVNERLHGDMVQYVEQLEVLVDAGVLLPTDGFYAHPKKLQTLTTILTTDETVATAAADVIRLNDSDLHSRDGPLWYRGNVACGELIEVDRLDASLQAIGAERVVIGHTPTEGRKIYARFSGKVIEVDTGMLNSYYEGHGSALVVSGDRFTAVNEHGKRWEELLPHPRYVGQRPPGLSDDGIEELLARGEIIADREDSGGRRIVSLSNGRQVIDAEFVRRTRRGVYPQVAAYRLDRLLELDMVPVAIKREFDGADGAMLFVPVGMTNEKRRRESGWGGGAMCPLPVQWEAMLIFDALIFNESRFTTTIQYDKSSWQLILTGHAGAFGTSKARPKHLAEVQLDPGPTWLAALRNLTDERLEEALGDVLDGRRIRALRARRDSLLTAR